MQNFIYHNTTKYIFGKGQTEQIAKLHLIPEGARVMMTYGGGSIKKNGVYEEVLKYVKPVVEFGGIEPNPSWETCNKAVQIAKENKIDFLLAVGGGSVVDGTKFISLAMEHTYSDDTYDILIKAGKFQVNPRKVGFGVILTIPATGSEMNCGFVLSRHATHEKYAFGHPSLYPDFSIVDPCHTFSLPLNQVRNGLTDSFVHCYEQYHCHYQMNDVADEETEGVMRTIMRVAPKTIADPKDYQSRANFCYAATVALNYTLAAGVSQCWAAHMLGHELTAYYGVAHGESLAITTPGVMRFYKEKCAKKYIQFGERVFGLKDPKPEDTIKAVEEWFKSIGMKTRLSEFGFTKEHFEEISKKFDVRPCGFDKGIKSQEALAILNDTF